MTTPRLTSAVERLLRAMPRNPDVIELGEALKEARAMVTAVVTQPRAVTQKVTPERDRAKYMRDYRARHKVAAL